MPATAVDMYQPNSHTWLPLVRTNDGFWTMGSGAFERPIQTPFRIRLHSPTGQRLDDSIGRIGKFMVVNLIPSETVLSLLKYEELGYPTHFLERAGFDIRKKLFEQNKPTYFSDEIFFTHEAKHILNRHSLCSCSDPISSGNIKKTCKKSHFSEGFVQTLIAVHFSRKRSW